MGASQRSSETPSPNTGRPLPYPFNCRLAHNFPLPLRYPSNLARLPPIHNLPSLLRRRHIRLSSPPLKLRPLRPHLVPLRLLLPRPPPPLPRAARNKKIHLRLPPPRHHLPRRLRSLRHRSPRLLHSLPRNHKYPPNPRLELPHPHLPRLRASHGPPLRLPRVLHEPALPRRL